MIHVLATVQLKPGKRVEFLKIFNALVPKVKAEAGCIEYGPTIDVYSGIPAQGKLREDLVIIIEKWQDLAALNAHLATSHMTKYREDVKDLVQNVNLQVLTSA
jgi:quinol monooxygenase YgiN